jgi:putative FmdB family regulatory protein
MAVYPYRCAECGPFDVRLPIGTAPATRDCPRCAAPASRTFAPPLLRQVSAPLGAVLQRAERSGESPDVVTSVPPKRRPKRSS